MINDEKHTDFYMCVGGATLLKIVFKAQIAGLEFAIKMKGKNSLKRLVATLIKFFIG